MRLSIAFARSIFIAIPNERQVKSFADDLITKRGVVSGRVALLLRSTETQPLLLDLENKSPPPLNTHGSPPRPTHPPALTDPTNPTDPPAPTDFFLPRPRLGLPVLVPWGDHFNRYIDSQRGHPGWPTPAPSQKGPS